MTRLVDGVWEAKKDLEASFAGLRYKQCEGLNAKGEPRAYTEEYADAEELRLYLPPKLTRKATELKFEFIFMGSQRQVAFDNFVAYISNRRLRYWDDVRRRQAEMYLSGEIEVSDEKLYGSTPYFIATFTFTCLTGYTTVTSDIATT